MKKNVSMNVFFSSFCFLLLSAFILAGLDTGQQIPLGVAALLLVGGIVVAISIRHPNMDVRDDSYRKIPADGYLYVCRDFLKTIDKQYPDDQKFARYVIEYCMKNSIPLPQDKIAIERIIKKHRESLLFGYTVSTGDVPYLNKYPTDEGVSKIVLHVITEMGSQPTI